MRRIVCTLRVSLHAVQLAQRFASKLARLCYYARFTRYKSCPLYPFRKFNHIQLAEFYIKKAEYFGFNTMKFC